MTWFAVTVEIVDRFWSIEVLVETDSPEAAMTWAEAKFRDAMKVIAGPIPTFIPTPIPTHEFRATTVRVLKES